MKTSFARKGFVLFFALSALLTTTLSAISLTDQKVSSSSKAFFNQDELLAVVKELPSNRWKEEVDAIDQAIEVLSDLRNKELAKAARAQNQGDRLQFQFPNLIDARRAWARADRSREIALRYQEEIDKLNARKEKILQDHGEPLSPSGDNQKKS